MPTQTAATPTHPLEPLTGEEIKVARDIVRGCGRASVPPDALHFAYVGLREPSKEAVRAADRGDDQGAPERAVRMVLVEGPEADVVDMLGRTRTDIVVSYLPV